MNSATIVQKLWNYCNVLRADGMSYGDYVEQFITGVLQALVRDGFLVQQNQRRWASYRLADGVEGAGDSRQSEADSPQSAGNSPQNAQDSPQSVSSSPQISAPVLSDHLEGLIPIAEP